MSDLKDRLRADLTASMKARDETRTATLRMILSAISTEEVSGKAAHELGDEDVLRVLTREAKKRREAADAFAGGGRPEQAAKESAEGQIIAGYLPAQLDDEQLEALVRKAVAETGATQGSQLGQVMRIAQAAAAGRVDGKRLSTEVRRQLAS